MEKVTQTNIAVGSSAAPGIPAAVDAVPRRHVGGARALRWACGGYLVFVVALWLTLRFATDRWWVATVVMFGPRWVWALPLTLLLPAVLVMRRRKLLWLLTAAAVVVAVPVMGLCVPVRRVLPPAKAPARVRLRVMTCNTDGLALDPWALHAYLVRAAPDVVLMQSCPAADVGVLFPDTKAWDIQRNWEFLVAARRPVTVADVRYLSDSDTGMGWKGDVAGIYVLQTPGGAVAVANIHLATARRPLVSVIQLRLGSAAEEMRTNMESRRRQFEAIGAWAEGEATTGPALVAGDFNTTSDSWLFRHYLPRFVDAFGSGGFGWGETHFTRRTRIRIDHVMAGLGWDVRRCEVGPPVGSAHRPVVADLEWPGT